MKTINFGLRKICCGDGYSNHFNLFVKCSHFQTALGRQMTSSGPAVHVSYQRRGVSAALIILLCIHILPTTAVTAEVRVSANVYQYLLL